MTDYEFNSQDKIVQQMTREGLIQENLSTGEQENISSKKADYEYKALKTLEKAINAATEVKEYHKYYSSSGSKEEPEEMIDEEDAEEYKSPYNHGEYNIQHDTLPTEKSDSSNSNENFQESREKKERFKEQEKDDKFTRKEGEKDYKFSRDDKVSEVASPQGNRKPLGRSSSSEGESLSTVSSEDDKNILKKWDGKIQKVEARIAKREENQPKERRLRFDKVTVEQKGELKSKRLRFEKVSLSKLQYKNKKNKKELRRVTIIGSAKMAGGNSWRSIRRENRDEIHESEAEYTKRGVYYGKRKLKKSILNISDYSNPYARLEREQKKLEYYRLRRDEAEYKGLTKEQKKMQKQMQKKRYMKAAVKKGTENRIIRHRNIFTRAKDGVAKVVKALKTFFSMVSSIFTIVIVIICLLFAIFILVTIALSFGTQSLLESTYQADYSQISGCSAYMKKLETDSEEKISKIEDEDSEYADCFEYNYDEVGEIGHDPIELMSYLAAKFVEFDLEKCREELDSLFEEMYTLTIEVVQEVRERELSNEAGDTIYDEEGNPMVETFMADICYVTLEVKPLGEIIAERLNDEQKEYYDVYMLSSGGQQVYANCLPDVNWGGLISSRFGERIHPITKERTFHKGVDIAVPTGTPLYSSAAGTVTTSAYSETAGHYIIVTMEGGWKITYMHLDSRGVSAGTEVMRGQFLGETGNSGKSTGPHLHLEVRDAKDNPIDPTFMIPSNSVVIEKQ